MPMDYTFNAHQFQPIQSAGSSHPPGVFDAMISETVIESTKDQTGGLFRVEFSTPAGKATKRYNLWNKEPKAVEIAHKELSALCHATGIYQLDFKNDGAALRNARLKLNIDYQKGEDPAVNPEAKGYTEIKKVLDVNGNEPGKAPVAAPQPMAPQQATGQAPVQPPSQGGGWGTPTPQAPQQAPTPPQNGAWQPGPTATPQQGQQPSNPPAPPWANR